MSQGAHWLNFKSWLDAQRGQRERASDDVPLTERPEPSSSSNAAASSSGPSTSSSSYGSSHSNDIRRPSRPPLARDCRAETRLTEAALGRGGRQEMTLVLAAPGMPLSKAPLISAKQMGALLQVLCEPLVQVSVGRLTRQFESPQLLHPTEDRGILSLWLLPNDDLSLVWQSKPPKNAKGEENGSTEVGVGGLRSPAGVQLLEESGEEVSLIEEVARFPAGSHLQSDEPLVTVHMLRGDSTGRSFYIRPRDDVAYAHNSHGPVADLLAAASAEKFPHQSVDSMGSSSSVESKEQQCGRRLYFWLREPSLTDGMHKLGRLKSLVKRPPSLSRRSGVPQRQLDEIANWIHLLDRKNLPQKLLADDIDTGTDTEGVPSDASSSTPQLLSGISNTASCLDMESQKGAQSAQNGKSSLQSLGLLPVMNREREIPIAHRTKSTGISDELLGAGSSLGQLASPADSITKMLPNGKLATTAAVTANAAAVYRDRRFHVSCPCNITVGATVSLQTSIPVESHAACSRENVTSVSDVNSSEEENDASSSVGYVLCEAASRAMALMTTARAKFKAEEAARAILDRLGRQRVEETICENLIRSTRAQRQRAKSERHLQREMQARQRILAEAQPLIRRAAEAASASLGNLSPLPSVPPSTSSSSYVSGIASEDSQDYSAMSHLEASSFSFGHHQSQAANGDSTAWAMEKHPQVPGGAFLLSPRENNEYIRIPRNMGTREGEQSKYGKGLGSVAPEHANASHDRRVNIANLHSVLSARAGAPQELDRSVLGDTIDDNSVISTHGGSTEHQMLEQEMHGGVIIDAGDAARSRTESSKITVADLIDLLHTSNDKLEDTN